MKRDDETLLEYLIRIAKEKGEGLGEGLQQLGVDRLREARPDAARRQGLMPDQLDIVEDTEVPFPPDRPPVFMPEDITSLMSTQDPTPDRASLEAMIAQPRTADPRALRETINRGVPGMTTNPTTGRTPIEDDLLMSWSGSGQAPLEPSGLMQQDLEQTRARERAQSFDQVTPGPVTPRVPTVDQGLTGADLRAKGQELLESTGNLVTTGDRYERQKGEEDLNKRLEAAATDDDPYAGVNPSLIDMVTGITEEKEILESDKTPGSDGKKIYGKELDFKRKPISSAARWITEDTPLGDFFFGEGEAEDSKESVHDWGGIDNVLKGKGDKTPSPDKAVQTVESESKKTGTGNPSFDGYGSKAEFFKAMGLSTEGNKYFERMDKIDSESSMFDMIAMLGGAGNSRAGANFRNKSYQRLRTEMQMDERDWDRAYKMFSHPWDTWFDEKGIRDPISRLRGTGPPPGEGWAKTRPPKEVRPTGPTQLLEEIKSSYDGSESSLDLIVMRLAMEDTANWGMDREGALEGAALYAQKLLKLPFTPWTDTEKSQARAMMAKDDVQNLMRMINSKSQKPGKPHIPADLKAEVEAFLTEEMRAKYDDWLRKNPNKDPNRMGLGGGGKRFNG